MTSGFSVCEQDLTVGKRMWTEKEEKSIVKSCIEAATKDIQKLSRKAYHYLSIDCCFSAHYEYNGFKHYYNDPADLKHDLFLCRDNCWHNREPGDDDYPVYEQISRMYRAILDGLKE